MGQTQQELGVFLVLALTVLLVFLALVARMVFLDKLKVRVIVAFMDYAMEMATA
jgi:hypothetical protein